jgi:hypothetical protein
MFKLFPELIAFYIDSNDRQASSEATLADERKTAELREQFVGVAMPRALRSREGARRNRTRHNQR